MNEGKVLNFIFDVTRMFGDVLTKRLTVKTRYLTTGNNRKEYNKRKTQYGQGRATRLKATAEKETMVSLRNLKTSCCRKDKDKRLIKHVSVTFF